jgi:hypothetical protein
MEGSFNNELSQRSTGRRRESPGGSSLNINGKDERGHSVRQTPKAK